MKKAILVIAAHADDEALGCGGTIAKHVAQGDEVHLLFMADVCTSRLAVDEGTDEGAVSRRNAAAYKAHAILGINSVQYLGLPDNRMDSLPLLEIVQMIEPVIARIAPREIYTHHHGDLNVDHRITHQAVITACRPIPGTTVCGIYAFEVLSSTEWGTAYGEPFIPNMFVDISEQLLIKQRALEAYIEEMRPVPHARSVKHAMILAKHRGYTVGLEAAEGFVVVRQIT